MLNEVKKLYPNLKKNRKILKILENIPKYKPPGIDIAIQGRHRDNYKIRINGARNKNQLYNITNFVNILLYLYIETYILKKSNRNAIKEKLKNLTNIAKRRSKVVEIVNYTTEEKVVKHMAKLDKQRLGFKPEKGQNQWSRSCQNSGNDKKRRPQQYSNKTISQLLKKGYKYNKKLDIYEKKTSIKEGNKKKDVILKTIKVPEYDNNGKITGNYIHYACNPEDNGNDIYIGFLAKAKNPFGHCMPCCYRKNPELSNNKIKKAFYESCLGNDKIEIKKEDAPQTVGSKLYILQDTNKIQDNRFGYLPTYLDRYFNYMTDKTKKIRHHYLEYAPSGYFFKKGTPQNEYQFLNAIGKIFNKSISDFRKIIINAIKNDTTCQIFTSLNNGDIRTRYNTRENYIEYIKESKFLDFLTVKDIICIPGIITKYGLNIIIFHKKEIKINRKLEKAKYIDEFYIECDNNENTNTITNPKYATIFLIKDEKQYHPISLITKTDKYTKNIEINDIFYINGNKNNIVTHVYDFYNSSCHMYNSQLNISKHASKTAKDTLYILHNIDKKYELRYQVIDTRNKCKYVITKEGILIPVKPSGTIWNIQIIKNYNKYIYDFEKTVAILLSLYKKTEKKLNVKPIGVYYENKANNTIKINSIITIARDIVPIIPTVVKISDILDKKLIMEKKSLNDDIDIEINKGSSNYIIDDRILKVNENIFIEESYNIFRLEFSVYINKIDNIYHRKRIEKIINSQESKNAKIKKIRLILYTIIDKKLYDKYVELIGIQDKNPEQIGGNSDLSNITERNKLLKKLYYIIDTNQQGGKVNKLIHKINKLPDIIKYEINNERKVCDIHKNNEICNNNTHCKWSRNNCYIALTNEMIVMFVNRISGELAENSMHAYEILQIDEYYVSDIVDRNNFTHTPGQKIIRASSSNIRNILQEIFGTDNIPSIGKRKKNKITEYDYDELNNENAIIDMHDIFIQSIINNNNSLFRAYANSLYWLENSSYNVNMRNLKYHSQLQTQIANNLRVAFINWIKDENNSGDITLEMKKELGIVNNNVKYINNFISKIIKNPKITTSGIIEYTILSKINSNIPIIIRGKLNNILHIYDNGQHITEPSHVVAKRYDPKKSINIRFIYNSFSSVPDIIDVIYYK